LLRWLGWLALEMRRRNQMLFAFEDLDITWLPLKRDIPLQSRQSLQRSFDLELQLAFSNAQWWSAGGTHHQGNSVRCLIPTLCIRVLNRG